VIFDFCNNFEFFRVNPKTNEGTIQMSLTEKIYNAKVEIIRELQDSNIRKRNILDTEMNL